MDKVLEVQEITKIYLTKHHEKYTAVNHVSFDIRRGESLGLVGESGCGKSTLAKLVTRLVEPDYGSIRFEGDRITELYGRELREVYRQIQMIFQSPAGSFDPRRTIGYSVGESLRNAGISRKERDRRIAGLLEQCGLPSDYANRYPHEISGGECQRAAIARALAVQPKLLICDEATSALDVTVQQQIMELLQMLKKETGLSFLFICHNLALVQSFCDRVLVMHDGCIVEEGQTDEVILHPKKEATRRLIEAAL